MEFDRERNKLAALIQGVYMGAPDSTEARVLCRHLVGTAWTCSAIAHRPSSAIEDLEFVLGGISKLLYTDGPVKVSRAKSWLRDFGNEGDVLAAELGKMSRPRNTKAHPHGAALLGKIEMLVSRSRPNAETLGVLELSDDTTLDPVADESSVDWYGIVTKDSCMQTDSLLCPQLISMPWLNFGDAECTLPKIPPVLVAAEEEAARVAEATAAAAKKAAEEEAASVAKEEAAAAKTAAEQEAARLADEAAAAAREAAEEDAARVSEEEAAAAMKAAEKEAAFESSLVRVIPPFPTLRTADKDDDDEPDDEEGVDGESDTEEKEEKEGKGAEEKDADEASHRAVQSALKNDTLGGLASELGLQLSDTALAKLVAIPWPDAYALLVSVADQGGKIRNPCGYIATACSNILGGGKGKVKGSAF